MSQALADSLRAETCVAVNNCYELAPWAAALCAQDTAWWRVHRKAHDFAGRKFSTNRIEGAEQVRADGLLSSQSSSGALGVWVAANILGADLIELHGFDNRGSHYFGEHQPPLRNPQPGRFREFESQLAAIGWKLKKNGIRVVNRTAGSALRCFPISVGML